MGQAVVKDHHLTGPQGCDRDLVSVHHRRLHEVGPDALHLSSLLGIAALAIRHLPINLELGEGAGQQVHGFGPCPAHDQVGHHVVRGAEGRPEDEIPATCQAGDPVERHEGRPADDGVPVAVQAPPTGAARELGELAGRQDLVRLAGELRQSVDHHRAGRQVNPEGERLGCIDNLQESHGEELLGDLLEYRDQPGVVGGHPSSQPVGPAIHAQGVQVPWRKPRKACRHVVAHGPGAGLVIQGHSIGQDGVSGLVTTRPAEDEVDGRKEAMVGQFAEYLATPRGRPP